MVELESFVVNYDSFLGTKNFDRSFSEKAGLLNEIKIDGGACSEMVCHTARDEHDS